MSHFRNHPNWQPVRKLYYKKYYSVIRVGNFFHRDAIAIDRRKFDGQYRIVDRYAGLQPDDQGNTAFASVASVYTNNVELLNYLDEEYNVLEVQTPYNEKHLTYLTDPNRDIIYRDKAWYDKYHHKVKVYETWRHRNSADSKKPYDLLCMFDDLFTDTDSRWQGIGRDHTPLKTHSRYFSYPTIYTNNEPSIMLLKMALNDVIRISVETVVTPDFLK